MYDIADNGHHTFHIQLPDTETETLFPTAVKLTSTFSGLSFLVYDTRHHPTSYYSTTDFAGVPAAFADIYCCGKCGKNNFKVAVGFEVPDDTDSANDITWFVLAAECVHCGEQSILFDNETA